MGYPYHQQCVFVSLSNVNFSFIVFTSFFLIVYIGLFFVIVHLRAGGFAHWRSSRQLCGRPPTSSLHAETAPIVSASTSRVFAQAVVVRFSGLPIAGERSQHFPAAYHHYRLRAAPRRGPAI